MFDSTLRPAAMIRAASRALPRALLSLLLLVACGGETRDDATASNSGGTMIVVQPEEPSTLFPPMLTSSAGLGIVDGIFDRLAEIGPELNVSGDRGFTPRLASSWLWAPDSLSIAFTLDARARWHDGAPVRAEDVRFTFAVYTADSVGSDHKSVLGNIDSVSVRDSLTAVFWFKRRLPHQFFEATYHMYMLPSHLLSAIGMDQLKDAPFGRAPVGTGRFRFASWERGVRMDMIADTANARGRALLDRVIWSFVKDYGTATVKLFAGEADFYEAIRPENIPEAERSATLLLQPAPTLQYGLLIFNLGARGDTTAPNPMFGDVRVRRALAMALDRVKMAKNVFDTLGAVSLAAAPRALIPDSGALRPLPYAPAAARALLDSAGWILTAGDSVRARDGVRLTFEVLAPQSSLARQRYATLLQEQLRAIGVDVRTRTLAGAAIGAQVMSHDFDAFVWVWGMTPGRLGMVQTWGSRGSQNMGEYRSRVFDVLLDSALLAFDDTRSRRLWTATLQQLIDDQPAIFLYEPQTPIAVHKRIRTAPLRPDAWYANLADWSIDPTQRIDRDRIGLGGPR